MKLLLLVSLFLFSNRGLGKQSRTILLAVGNQTSYKIGLSKLKFVSLDLHRVVKALRETAGLNPSDIYVSENISFEGLRNTFQKLKRDLDAFKEDTKLIFYYSGHSDPRGLHLTDRILARSDLHQWLEELPSKNKLVFLDSCFSGALTPKGVSIGKAFARPKAQIDEPTGTVFIAATSGGEFAYEINSLEGSLFTHYLVSGLYGQADSNKDGVVTIEELYFYTFREMKLYSMSLPGRSQEPEARIDLKGKGSLIISRPQQNTAIVSIPKNVYGTIVLAQKNGSQIFRVQKTADEATSIRVLPGIYKIAVSNTKYHGKGELHVTGSSSSISIKDLILDEDFAPYLVSKGLLHRENWSLSLGFHQGIRPLSHNGSFIDLAYRWSATNVRGVWLRPGFSITMRQNGLRYNGATGRSYAVGGQGFIQGLWRIFQDNHKHWLSFALGLGASQEIRHWATTPVAEPSKDGTKATATISYHLISSQDFLVDAFFRREGHFLRSVDAQTIAYSASLFGIGILL